MWGMAELVERRDAFDLIACGSEQGGIAGEALRIAGDRDDKRNVGGSQSLRLGLRTCARGIEQDRVVARKLLADERAAEEVADFARDRLQADCIRSCLGQCRER